MTEQSPTLSASEIFRLGRRHLDGASFEWLAERTQWTVQDIEDAWEQCRKHLSRYLADDNETPLSDDEIAGKSEQCLRLLLQWQEQLELSDRMANELDGANSNESTVEK